MNLRRFHIYIDPRRAKAKAKPSDQHRPTTSGGVELRIVTSNNDMGRGEIESPSYRNVKRAPPPALNSGLEGVYLTPIIRAAWILPRLRTDKRTAPRKILRALKSRDELPTGRAVAAGSWRYSSISEISERAS